jgi:hypothetical protein
MERESMARSKMNLSHLRVQRNSYLYLYLSPVSKPPAKKEESKDEKIAHQLAARLNAARARSSGSDKRPAKKLKPKKSATRVGGIEEGDEAFKKRARDGFQKEYT